MSHSFHQTFYCTPRTTDPDIKDIAVNQAGQILAILHLRESILGKMNLGKCEDSKEKESIIKECYWERVSVEC